MESVPEKPSLEFLEKCLKNYWASLDSSAKTLQSAMLFDAVVMILQDPVRYALAVDTFAEKLQNEPLSTSFRSELQPALEPWRREK